ncbi:ABC transporter permease subunit [Lyngbya aestuarii]|uniref:ABC transporter permease subunit n=1 Tax=Lyngbya aestuarii TaxID=118322 RepID=UPI00403D9873
MSRLPQPGNTHNGINWRQLLRDVRFWKIAGQVIAIVVLVSVVAIFTDNLLYNLGRLNIELGFDFLDSQASFDIGESSIAYDRSSSYARALLVGLINSLKVTGLGLIFATIIGLVAGIARLSDNWLLRKLALVYVEIFRNLPLLLQLFFWYFAVFLKLPPVEKAIALPGRIFFSNRGVFLPWFSSHQATAIWLVLLGVGVVAALGGWRWRSQMMVEQGRPSFPVLWASGVFLCAVLLALIITKTGPFLFSLPQMNDAAQLEGGLRLTPEFCTILVGLVVYTGSFIAEIVRGGIQSVPQGQREAGSALGLKSGQLMRLVILPQALRVIIPPLTSQYLNLAKNSSLAIAIGFPDIYFVASTTFNQTGRAVEVMLLIMVTYLTISLTISVLMNLFNQQVQIKER